MRCFLVLCMMLPLALPMAARAAIYGFKIHFGIDKSGKFSRTDFASLDPQGFTAAEVAGCAAFGVTCTTEDAAMDMPRFRTLASEDARTGHEYRGLYRSPPGFEVCKAKVDWDHATIDDGVTLSATMARDRKDNGLAYSATVPDGASIAVDLFVEFVPLDTAVQFECFPKNSVLWKCSQKACPDKGAFDGSRGIYPPARFP